MYLSILPKTLAVSLALFFIAMALSWTTIAHNEQEAAVWRAKAVQKRPLLEAIARLGTTTGTKKTGAPSSGHSEIYKGIRKALLLLANHLPPEVRLQEIRATGLSSGSPEFHVKGSMEHPTELPETTLSKYLTALARTEQFTRMEILRIEHMPENQEIRFQLLIQGSSGLYAVN